MVLISLGHLTVIFSSWSRHMTLLTSLFSSPNSDSSGTVLRLDPSSSASSWYTDVMVHSQVLCSSLYGRSHSCLHLHLRPIVDELKIFNPETLHNQGPLDITNSVSSELCFSNPSLLEILNCYRRYRIWENNCHFHLIQVKSRLTLRRLQAISVISGRWK